MSDVVSRGATRHVPAFGTDLGTTLGRLRRKRPALLTLAVLVLCADLVLATGASMIVDFTSR
ncbi:MULTISPECIES: hypothetical protein [unclassified Bradyrhizobium]|uniref:hypothetical protein n=1 Tax=unclassified Bradyrhizobium TaxID=2631580 RepID=UPI001FD9998B|nr:hypothetical protein [Bradyrhizobium sp. WSM1253]